MIAPHVCPHCLHRPRDLASHITFGCPVLTAKRERGAS